MFKREIGSELGPVPIQALDHPKKEEVLARDF